MIILISLFLSLSLIFTGLAIFGLFKPIHSSKKGNTRALRRYGLLAVLCYTLMAIFLSIRIIDQRGYDQRIEQSTGFFHPYRALQSLSNKHQSTHTPTSGRSIIRNQPFQGIIYQSMGYRVTYSTAPMRTGTRFAPQ